MELYNDNRQSEDKRGLTGEDVLQQNFSNINDQPPQYELPRQSGPSTPYPQGVYPQGAYPQGAYPQGAHPQQHNYSPYPPQAQQGPYVHSQQTVVVQTGAPIIREYVESYMAWSILNCLFCCWILGIVAIIMSSMVSSENGRGNVEGARKNSRAALGLNIAATSCGVVLIIVLIAVNVALQQ